MISVIIVCCLHVVLLVSGITRLQQTGLLSAPLTSFLLYEDKLYIGGANRIYVLNKDLKQIQTANSCESRSDACSRDINFNKIFLVYDSEQFHVLVSCGTGNSGLCEARNLSQIESVLWSSSDNHADDNYLKVSANKNRPAVGLITENGEFVVALTFGDDIYTTEIKSQSGNIGITYNYAISARKLDGFQPVTRNHSKSVLTVQISTVPIDKYLIHYKVCFQHNRMTYFATNQKSEVGSQTFVSKLVRICQNDTGFQSYTDIIINCIRSNVTYNLIQDVIIVDSQQHTGKVLIGVFTRGDNPEQVSGDSAICVTEMENVDKALASAYRAYAFSCNESGPESSRYLPSHKRAKVCVRSEVDFKEIGNTCKAPQTYSNVISKDPINIEANVYTPTGSGFITTLASATYENKTVIMFGTSKGNVIQTVLVENYTTIENYKMTVDFNEQIMKIYAVGEDTVYVMSNKRVFKYATTNCSEFKSCADMTKRKHPLCGWCLFRGRATRRSACPEKPGHWISSFGTCLSISFLPVAIPLSTASTSSNTNIRIDIQNIPEKNSNDTYHCRFSVHSDGNKISSAKLYNRTLICLLPIVSVPGDVKIELLVVTQAGIETSLSSASIRIYECRQYKRCMECINTVVDHCIWCGQVANCQEKKAGCTESGPISDVSKCPQLLHNNEIFIPTGTMERVSLKIANALNFSGVIYRCILSSSESVIATLIDDSVSCQAMYNGLEKKRDVRIVIKYGPGIDRLVEIDDPFANSVTVYRCISMASDCSHCQALNKSRYDCYWGNTSECIHAGAKPVSHCPSPLITKVIPTDGSIYGGTLVTVYGRDLGRKLSDVNNIAVANVTCDLINDKTVTIEPDYESLVPSRLICKSNPNTMATTGNVAVVVEGKLSNTNVEFSYKSPSISHIYPNFGPKAGGTKITVYGKHLSIGNRNRILFLGQHQCEQIKEVAEEISHAEDISFECVIRCGMYDPCTSIVKKLKLSMDGETVNTDRKEWFSFVDNPVIGQVPPLKAFVSGGTLFTIDGMSLNNAHSSSVKLHYKEENTIAKCDIKSASRAVCRAPKAPNALKEELAGQWSSAEKDKHKCDISINVSMELYFDAVIHKFRMSYYNDPVFDILPEDGNVLTFDSREPWIFLSGKCLSTTHRDFKIEIKVGNKSCIIEITSVTENSIKCFVPAKRPSVLPWSKEPKISVTLGNINVTIGYLRYKSDEQEVDRTMLIVYISVAALFILIVILGALFVCRRFRKLKNRVTYLEVKKGVVKQRPSRNKPRQTIECNTAFNQSGVYDEINDDGVPDNPVVIIGKTFDDEDEDYLVPHTYIYIDQISPLEEFRRSNRKINPIENIDNDSLNQDAYIHPIYDVREGETPHVIPVNVSKEENDALEKAEVVMGAKGVVSFSCNKVDTGTGDTR